MPGTETPATASPSTVPASQQQQHQQQQQQPQPQQHRFIAPATAPAAKSLQQQPQQQPAADKLAQTSNSSMAPRPVQNQQHQLHHQQPIHYQQQLQSQQQLQQQQLQSQNMQNQFAQYQAFQTGANLHGAAAAAAAGLGGAFPIGTSKPMNIGGGAGGAAAASAHARVDDFAAAAPTAAGLDGPFGYNASADPNARWAPATNARQDMAGGHDAWQQIMMRQQQQQQQQQQQHSQLLFPQNANVYPGAPSFQFASTLQHSSQIPTQPSATTTATASEGSNLRNIPCCGTIHANMDDLLRHYQLHHADDKGNNAQSQASGALANADGNASNFVPIQPARKNSGSSASNMQASHAFALHQQQHQQQQQQQQHQQQQQQQTGLWTTTLNPPQQHADRLNIPTTMPMDIGSHQHAAHPGNAHGHLFPAGTGNVDADLSALLAAEPPPQADDAGSRILAKRNFSMAAFSMGSYAAVELKRFREEFRLSGVDFSDILQQQQEFGNLPSLDNDGNSGMGYSAYLPNLDENNQMDEYDGPVCAGPASDNVVTTAGQGVGAGGLTTTRASPMNVPRATVPQPVAPERPLIARVSSDPKPATPQQQQQQQQGHNLTTHHQHHVPLPGAKTSALSQQLQRSSPPLPTGTPFKIPQPQQPHASYPHMQPQHVPKPPPRNQPVMSAVAPPTGDDLMMDYMISNFQASSLSTPSALPSREIKQPSHFSLDGQQQQHAAPDAAIDAVGVAGNGGLSGHYEHGFLAAGDGIGADAISAQIDHFRQHEQPSQQRDFQSQQQQQQQFQQRPLSTASVDSAGSQQHQQPLHQQRIVHPNTKLEHFDSFDSATSATTPQLGHTHAKIEPNAATHPASTPSVKPIKPKKTKPASDTPPGPPKPHPCPHPGCTKSYKNPNGLKYHLEHGHPELNPDPMPGGGGGVGSTSDPDGKDGGGKADKDDFKPFMCRHEGCDKLYKNLNGLKYHLVHAHGFAEADTKDVLSRAKADAREAGWIPPSLGRGRGRSAGALSAPGLAAGGAASSTTTTPTGEMGGGASEQLHEDDVGGMLEQLLDLADAAHAQHEQQQHEQQQQQQLHLHQQHQPNHNTHPYT